MGKAQLVLVSSSLTRAQWDLLVADLTAFLTAHSALGVTIDKSQSGYTEAPP
jgi:hypothetical protein